MSDLRRIAQTLIDRPPLEPMPMEELRRRSLRRGRRRALAAGALLTVLALVGGLIIVRPGNRESSKVSTVPSLHGPLQVSTLEVGGATDVAIGSNAVWVPGADVVRRVDPVANAVTATIAVPGTSDYRSVVVAFGSAWVTDTGTGILTRIDETTNRVVASIPIGGSPTRMAAAGGLLWVALPDPNQPGGEIVPVDPATNLAGQPVAISASEPAPFATLTSFNGVLFSAWGSRLVRIEPANRSVQYFPKSGAAHGEPVPIGVAAGGGHRFVLESSGEIVEFNPTGSATSRRSSRKFASAQRITVGGGSVWVLVQPSSTKPSKLLQLDSRTLTPVRKPIEVGLTAVGLAAGPDTTWVASGGDLTRIDAHAATSRPELCPRPVPIGRGTADGLPNVADAITDRAVAERELLTDESNLRAGYPAAVAITVGPGEGRAYVKDGTGRITVVSVADYALIVHFGRRADCSGARRPVETFVNGVAVLFAWDGHRSSAGNAGFLTPRPGAKFLPAVQRRGDQRLMPVTFINGDTAVLSFPSRLGLDRLGLRPGAAVSCPMWPQIPVTKR